MGLIGRTFQLVGVLFVLLVGLSTYLYFVDYGVEATVTGKGEDTEGAFIVLTTHIGDFQIRHHLPEDVWATIEPGNFVTYHIQTGNVAVYEYRGGPMLYSSA